ncbi:capsule assembly Wzi family protein [Hydrogenimonas cancrithermarum]|uniref:Capsule assembly protein Wzi n=1 Tax=Hydrogenimonas cancrithermarum TaxID=2993563 RepID=A0ABN6WWB9_9BACT|nr:capsule assembly Wzi family protein [Hydrogenimonas cancrithermarum]BDY13405.1 hypothetical protein HCR_17170 [Hydrogenimonas cancrithermarum]
MKKLTLPLLAASLLWGGNVDIPLDSPLYAQLERLKSLGAIEAALPMMKPFNTDEVEALLDSMEEPSAMAAKRFLERELRRYKRTAVVEAGISATYADKETAVPNAQGRVLRDGANADASVRMQMVTRKLGLVFTPGYRDNASDSGGRVGDTYLRIPWKNMNITLGREALWMGAGREGTLLFSQNAKSLDIARFSSRRPFRFHPYRHNILNKLFGAMDVDFFVGRLHRYDTIVKEDGTIHSGYPKLMGMQFTFRPWDLFSVGIYRTALFGGGGRDESFSTFWKVLFPFGQSENTGTLNEPGDQKGGFNFEWYIPNTVQPLKLYGEWAGEDEAGMLPYKESYIVGILFSDTGNIEGLQTSFEHLKMYKVKNLWYHHHIYRDGYTNDGMIMGHYNGSNGSRDILRVKYLKDIQSDYTLAWEHFSGLEKSSDTLRFGVRYRAQNSVEYGVDGSVGEDASWLGVKVKWIF